MERCIMTGIVFLFIYLMYAITVIHNKTKIKNFDKSSQAAFIIKKYGLTIKNNKNFARVIALANSAILSITFLITDFMDHYMLKFLVGFCILIPAIIGSYHIIGKVYQKKEGKNHVSI